MSFNGLIDCLASREIWDVNKDKDKDIAMKLEKKIRLKSYINSKTSSVENS